MELHLDGKTAIICGASQGIGRAIAQQFAICGANIIAIARNELMLKDLISSLPKEIEQKHYYISVDFSTPEKAMKIIEDFIHRTSNIQILVNNNGGPAPSPAHIATAEEYKKAFDMHLIISQLLAQFTIPMMKKAQYGRIINIISVGAKQPIENLGVSNTIRGAMMSWSKTLSKELAQFGITVNNILPGFTRTSRLESLIKSRADNEGKTIEEIENEIISKIPTQRLGKPQEIAYLAAFLAGEYAEYINGTSIPVDGGFLSCL